MNEPLVMCFIPSLASLVLAAEAEKGEVLTQAEVLAVRDSAVCIMLPSTVYDEQVRARGYKDIDPQNVWNEYLMMCQP